MVIALVVSESHNALSSHSSLSVSDVRMRFFRISFLYVVLLACLLSQLISSGRASDSFLDSVVLAAPARHRAVRLGPQKSLDI